MDEAARRLASLRGRIGAYVMHSRNDSRATSAKAREAFMRRFELEVDPEGVLPAAERARRADAAQKAYFTRLALRSAQARQRQRK